MPARAAAILVALAIMPRPAVSQSPVADAFRAEETRAARNLLAAAEGMPANAYGYKPTPAQMSLADVVLHLAEGNDFFCGTISGEKAPTRPALPATAPKDALVTRLKETFEFCDQTLAKVDDSKLGEELPFFGGRKLTRARVMIIAADDWGDHYSQAAIYLRLNGVLPPTAKAHTP